MEMISRSLRLKGSKSIRLGRSNSMLLDSEIASSEFVKISGYERLSKSMRFPILESKRSGGGSYLRGRKTRARALLNKVFSCTKTSGDKMTGRSGVVSKEDKKKDWHARWLPDPNRRWPVQGW